MKGYRKFAITALGIVAIEVLVACWGDRASASSAVGAVGVCVGAFCAANYGERSAAARAAE